MARSTCPTTASRLIVDLDALCRNYASLCRKLAPAACGAVVKANAYGLGAVPVVEALRAAGCRLFFTAHLAEALDLMSVVDPTCQIVILNGLDPDCEAVCAEHGFVPVLNSMAQIERWRALAIARGRRLPAALQVDSGMSRLGLTIDDARAVSTTAIGDHIDLRLILTHLACADDPDHEENRAQRARFEEITRLFPGIPASIANSGAAFLTPEFHLDIARCGIALYGVAPTLAQPSELRSVVRLDARVIQIREIEVGTGIGYGFDHIARRPMRIATVGIGYADGISRRFALSGAAWYQQHRLPLVGRISMDSLAIDISDLPDGLLAEGGFVELIGPCQSLEAMADAVGTIPYEILTGLGRRHERLYVQNHRSERHAAGAWS